MSKLRIAENLTLPLEAVTQTFGILGKRGGGKTFTAKVLAEEMLKADAHICAVDPIGNWWGLRVASDGKSPGLPITVLGGDYGDIPIEAGEKAGEFVARLMFEEKLSLVIDLSKFRKGEQLGFMIGWAETLYRLSREPLHLFIDEADAFAPQRPLGNLAPRLLGAMEDRPPARNADQAAGNIGKGERKILSAIAQYPAGATRQQLTVLTGYKRSSRDTYLQRLQQWCYVSQGTTGLLFARPEGVEALGSDHEPLPRGEDLRIHWRNNLPEGERRILEVLLDAYPQAVDREALSESTGYKRSSRDTYLQRLGARQLVTAIGRGEVKASDELFEE